MHSSSHWTVKKQASGYTLTRPRPSMFAETVNLHIASAAASEWRAAFSKILQRIHVGRFRSLRITLGLRCMLGCWRGVQRIRCYGGLPDSCHVLAVGDSLFLFVDVGDPAAYPISSDELESIVSQMA
jgi:hypothetical protein